MSTKATQTGLTGREASIARRKALSQGKAALPPAASERVRSGFRQAELPKTAPVPPSPEGVPVVGLPETSPPPGSGNPVLGILSGRAASMARRKALSAGKAALPPAQERARSGFRDAAMPDTCVQHAAPTSDAAAPLTGREAAMEHRSRRAKFGRGNAPAPTTPSRKGDIAHPPKVPSIRTASVGATVTGLSYAAGRAMTGAEAGHDKPLTGTQYVDGNEGGYRAGAAKVGHARTFGGQTVSGTMVRSTVPITGDEDSADARITGNADQVLTDDLSARSELVVPVATQFQRQSQPHGQSVHGTNLGRSAKGMGSRRRETERPVEQTENGHAVSGTAIGRSARVTGDEPGATQRLTGSQYIAPSADRAPDAGRSDPVSGEKVTLSQTWGGQTVSGPKMEHDARCDRVRARILRDPDRNALLRRDRCIRVVRSGNRRGGTPTARTAPSMRHHRRRAVE